MFKVGIIGGAGYTGGELIRLLMHHPQVDLQFVHSNSQAGQKVSAVHKDLLGDTDLEFIEGQVPASDVVFLCLGHGKSQSFLERNTISETTRIIDLSQDFRHQNSPEFIYGLPEANRSLISGSTKVANPGCFATAIQLALLPLAQANLLEHDVHIQAITGSTGAGVSPLPTTHFSWRAQNLSEYKAFEHQHLQEITETISNYHTDVPEINFIPVRGDFPKGIFCTAYTNCDLTTSQALTLYQDFYQEHPFTWVSDQNVSLKEVINTNKCFVQVQQKKGKLLITSIIDNLIKGASGQAIQNMNLMLGLPETSGLKLKAVGF